MKATILSDALNGDNLLPGRSGCERKARPARGAINQHGAGGALAFPTTVLRPRQVQLIPEGAKQRGVRLGVDNAPFPVDVKLDLCRHRKARLQRSEKNPR